MAESDRLARAHYRQQQVLARQVADALAEVWALLDTADLIASWAAVAARAAQLVALGQYAAAARSIAYIRAAIEAEQADPTPLAEVDPRALSGVAADGAPLSSLLLVGVYRTRQLLAVGVPLAEALAAGQSRLLRVAVNEVVQAGISGSSASLAATPTANGYVRVLVPPSCSRCIVLAGKHFEWSAGFLRHPLCDCVHRPYVGDPPAATINPEAAFRSMSEVEQDATFTKAGAEAIRNGADIGRVVNARQSTYVPKGRRTSRGTPTRRTVEDLLAMSNGDRNRFVALLDSAGYLR